MSEHGYDLEAMRTGLAAIFRKISGLSSVVSENAQAVTQQDQPWVMANQDTDARLTFNTVSIRSIGGADEVRQEYDPDLEFEGDTSGPDDEPANGGFAINVGGPRVWTLTIKVECWDLNKTAFEYAERARANLQRPSVLAMIVALGCSLNDVRASRDISFDERGRRVSAAVFELVLNITSNLDDDPVTTIETVNVTPTVHV